MQPYIPYPMGSACPTYPHPGFGPLPQQPTCWLAAAKLPATPPNASSDATRHERRISPHLTLPPSRRPSLIVDCTIEGGNHTTPALSYTSSSSSISGRNFASAPPSIETALGVWTSPERLPPVQATSTVSPHRQTRARAVSSYDAADVPHESARSRLDVAGASVPEQAHEASKLVTAHPRIVKAPTDRRPGFVEGLVDVSEIAISSIWSATSADWTTVADDGQVLQLRWFIKETLRRSRTSCSTLQLALFYLHKARMRIRDRVLMAERAKAELANLAAMAQYPTPPASPLSEAAAHADPQKAAELVAASRDPLCCGRRMFLAALICGSKFLQDRNYSSRAWSKISGLSVHEINANERALLHVLDYELFVRTDLFANWTQRLEALAFEYARQHGIDYPLREELSPTPMSPHHGRPLSSLPRSTSEYPPAPEPCSDIHANLPTPVLSHDTSMLASVHVRRSTSDSGLSSCALSRQSTVGLTRSCQPEPMIDNWLAGHRETIGVA